MTDQHTPSSITVHDADGVIVPDAAGVLRGISAEHIDAHNEALQQKLDEQTEDAE
jgi:hypothetical protein